MNVRTENPTATTWSSGATLVYWIEMVVAAVYLAGSTYLVIFAGGWHMPDSHAGAFLALVGVYFVGGVTLLVLSSQRWRSGSKIGYVLPLLLPLLTVATIFGVALIRPPVY